MSIEEKLERGLFELWIGASYRTEQENVLYVYRGYIDQPCGSRRHVFAPFLEGDPRIHRWTDYYAVKYETLKNKFQKFPTPEELIRDGKLWED